MWQDDIISVAWFINAGLERAYTSAGPPVGDQASDQPWVGWKCNHSSSSSSSSFGTCLCWLQEWGFDELHKLKETAAEEILMAENTAARDTERVTSLYKGHPRKAYDIPYPTRPAAPGFARPPPSSQACSCSATAKLMSLCWQCICKHAWKLYKEYSRRAYGISYPTQPADPSFARPPLSSQVRSISSTHPLMFLAD